MASSNFRWTEQVTDLPPNKRYICTHNPEGKSVYDSSPPQLYGSAGAGGALGMAHSYSIGSVPVQMKNDEDVAAYKNPDGSTSINSFKSMHIVVPQTEATPNGVNCVVVDIPPGGRSGMHRTLSIDFSICVIGTIVHELDSGEKVTLKPGDHIVQRGTMHKWHNGSDTEPARFVAVTIPAIPFEIPGLGEMLREVHLPEEGPKL